MKPNIFFIADFLKSQNFSGGAENNDSVLIDHLKKEYTVHECLANNFNPQWLGKNNIFIIGNFISLSPNIKKSLENEKYIIYEHDHKYVNTRDPSHFRDFKIPERNIVNRDFYLRAHRVVVLSQVCKNILKESLGLNNVHSIGTSLWSDNRLDLIKSLNSPPESSRITSCGVLKSANEIKGQSQAEKYCKLKEISYSLISSPDEIDFLSQLSRCQKFVFIPQVLETFCRLAAEIKMLNVTLITRLKMLGFASEECFSLSGDELVEDIRIRKNAALQYFTDCIEEIISIKQKKKIAFIGKFNKVYDEEGKARALERLGHEVVRYDEFSFNRHSHNSTTALLNQHPDVLIYTKLRIPHAEELLKESQSRGITTVCWVPDLYFGLERERLVKERSPIFTSDFVFTPDGGNQHQFEKLGVNHICVRQGIPEEYLCDPSTSDTDRDLDIVFIGTCQSVHGPRRKNLLNYLQRTYGDRFHWFGKAGDNEVRESELQKIYNRAKIVIGDCVPSPKYWSNRVYEVMGRGAFLLHPRVESIEDDFIDGHHASFFEMDNYADLSSKIDFYLTNHEKREAIAQNGLKEVSLHHTTQQRAQAILEIIK